MGYSRFFQSALVSRAKDLASTVARKAGELKDPLVGEMLLKIQRAELLTRVDGRTLEQLVEQGGLLQRSSPAEILTVTRTRVEEYQTSNLAPFGWGACNSMDDLLPFLKANGQTKDATVFKFYGRASSLNYLKLKTGMEGDGYDDEREYVVTEMIPIGQFLGASCPMYRDKLILDLEVPNLMHGVNSELPKTMRRSDFNSPEKVLSWLFINGSEKVFGELSTHLYAGTSQEFMERQLQENPAVMEQVRLILSRPQMSL